MKRSLLTKFKLHNVIILMSSTFNQILDVQIDNRLGREQRKNNPIKFHKSNPQIHLFRHVKYLYNLIVKLLAIFRLVNLKLSHVYIIYL